MAAHVGCRVAPHSDNFRTESFRLRICPCHARARQYDAPVIERARREGNAMDRERLHTISVSVCPDSYLVIPVRADARDDGDDRAPRTCRRASLTPAQGDVLYRHAAAFRDVAEQIRALARGDFTGVDL